MDASYNAVVLNTCRYFLFCNYILVIMVFVLLLTYFKQYLYAVTVLLFHYLCSTI